MSNTQGSFGVLLFGLSRQERGVVGRIFSLTSSCQRRYHIVSPHDYSVIDLALVDSSHVDLFGEWLIRWSPPNLIPIQLVREFDAEQLNEGDLKRPLNSTKILAALDRLTISDLKYVPELVISDSLARNNRPSATLSQVSESIPKSGMTALVVDDSAIARKMMGIEFGLFGISVQFAQTGREAVQRFNKGRYDIVCLDVILPDIDGFKLCKMIKTQSTSASLVCMVTSKASPIDRLKGIMAGCDVYLTKPVKPHKLHKVINDRLLNHASLDFPQQSYSTG